MAGQGIRYQLSHSFELSPHALLACWSVQSYETLLLDCECETCGHYGAWS
jgi:hypothetical protein